MVDCRRFLTYYRFQRPNLYDTDVGRSVAMCRRDSRGKGVVCSRGTMKLRMRVKNVGLCINTSLAVQVRTKLLPCTPEKGLKHTVTKSSFHINWLSRHTVARRNKLTGDRGLRGEAKIKSWPYEIVDYAILLAGHLDVVMREPCGLRKGNALVLSSPHVFTNTSKKK